LRTGRLVCTDAAATKPLVAIVTFELLATGSVAEFAVVCAVPAEFGTVLAFARTTVPAKVRGTRAAVAWLFVWIDL